MTGSIRVKTDKSGRDFYEVVMEFRDPATGKRVQRSKSFAGKRDAKRFLAEHQVAQERGGAVEPARLTVGELLETWLTVYAAHKVGLKTFENYEGTIRKHLMPALGAITVQRLTATRLDAFYATKRKDGCSEAVLDKCHQRMRQVLAYAVRQDVVSRNVADAATAPHDAKREMKIWTQEQAQAFIAVADQSAYGPLWLLALCTGMRRGEVLGLRWKDVDLDASTLQVRQTVITLKSGPYIKEPKTKSSRRPVGIPAPVVAALRDHRRGQNEQRLQRGAAWQDNDLVFASALGTPLEPTALQRDFHNLTARAGVPRIRVHDLRHTFATLALEGGANLLGVSRQLGHSKPSTSSDVYGHVTQRMQQQVTDTVSTALFGAESNPNMDIVRDR